MAKITVVDLNKLVGRGDAKCAHCKQLIAGGDARINTLGDGSVHLDCHISAVATGAISFNEDAGGVHVVTYPDDLNNIFATYEFLLDSATQLALHYRLNWDPGKQFDAKHGLETLRDLQAPVIELQKELADLMKDIAEDITEDGQAGWDAKPRVPEVTVKVPAQKKPPTPAKPKRAPANSAVVKKSRKTA